MKRRSRAIGKSHPLVTLLVANGFTVRTAHKVVNVIFDACKAALRRGENVELPFGTLKVVPHNVRPYRRWRWNRPVEFYRKRFHVVFTPRKGTG